jgi:tetratricopeptide (TPR) repeat protein
VGVDCNRLGVFWRPIIDMSHSELAPTRLRMIRPVAAWIADPSPGRVSWFSRIGVPGMRQQVLRHAGLEQYDCQRPQDMPAELRMPGWQRLVEVLEEFAGLDDWTRALVVFQLAQLSFCHYAIALTGVVAPTGEPDRDHYAYMVARVHARIPGQADRALPVFETLATTTPDPRLALLSCFQGIGHLIRGPHDHGLALRFEEIGRGLGPLPDSWQAHLAQSRYHRALALLRVAERRPDGMHDELRAAWREHEQLAASAPADETTSMIVTENRLIMLESEIKACFRPGMTETGPKLLDWAGELSGIDPNCVEALLVVGDAYVLAGHYAEAARCYSWAGELGTASGAAGWYRAAQCYDRLGDHISAINAMGHCLELDTTAIEPKHYLTSRNGYYPDDQTGCPGRWRGLGRKR